MKNLYMFIGTFGNHDYLVSDKSFVIQSDKAPIKFDAFEGKVIARNSDAAWQLNYHGSAWTNPISYMINGSFPVFIPITEEYMKANFKELLVEKYDFDRFKLEHLSLYSEIKKYLSDVHENQLLSYYSALKEVEKFSYLSDRQLDSLSAIKAILKL